MAEDSGPDYQQEDNGSMYDELVSNENSNGKRSDEAKQFTNSKTKVDPITGEVPDDDRGAFMYFNDRKRRVDYILVWDNDNVSDSKKKECAEARRIFEENLKKEGLQLELDETLIVLDPDDNQCSQVQEKSRRCYTKIHAPFSVLCRYAEVMKIKMPLRESPASMTTNSLWTELTSCLQCITRPFELDKEAVPEVHRKSTRVFELGKKYLFDIPETNEIGFFPHSTRNRVVNYILRRQMYSEDGGNSSQFKFGIKRLLTNGTYIAAYPLHEGRPKLNSNPSMRKLLWANWANWRAAFKYQPLHYIRMYFGEKIAFYFAWLGYYNFWLIPASLIGLSVFIYGIVTAPDNIIGRETCNPSSNYTMCPMCNARCGYWSYNQLCWHVFAGHVFDNDLTFFFSIFMCLWGTFYLEFWKRMEASIRFEWNLSLSDVEQEPSRPEYLTFLENSSFQVKYGKLPFWQRQVPVYCVSFVVMLFLCLCCIAIIVGVVFYRMSLLAALYLTDNPLIYRNARIAVSISAALINLIAIFFLNFIYRRLATVLTDWEQRRTQAEYDRSLTMKLYLLQFVNHYSSLFYIAFFKGRFAGTPAHYRTLFGARQEECQGGCLTELCIQLAIVFVGKQLISNLVEIFMPRFKAWYKNRKSRSHRVGNGKSESPWERDFRSQDIGPCGLFDEYLEMMIQFGFVTLFVAAFPLAPVFALLNNLIELRSDANKFLTQYRRPVAARANSIGAWYDILYAVSRLAVLMNAFIIAFTSRFIDRLVYKAAYSSTHSLEGFVNNSLSYFSVHDFPIGTAPNPEEIKEQYNGTTVCRYLDYRHPPWSEHKYTFTAQYWHIVAAKFMFVVCFENVVIILTSLIDYMIPDVPTKLSDFSRKETVLTNEIILQAELNSTKMNNRQLTDDQMITIRKKAARYDGTQFQTSGSDVDESRV